MYTSYVLRGTQAGKPVELEGDIDQERCPCLNLNNGQTLLHYLVESVARDESAAESWEEAELTVAFPGREHHYIFLDGRWMRWSNESTRRNRALWGFLLGLIGLLSYLTSLVLLSFPPNPNDASYVPPIGWTVTWFIAYVIAIATAIIGIVFSSWGLKSTTRKGFALSGLILSVIALVFTIFGFVILGLVTGEI